MPCGSTLNCDASTGPATTKLAASSPHAQRDAPTGRQIRTPNIATPATGKTQSHERAMVVRQAATLVVHDSSGPGTKLVAPPYSRRRIVATSSDSVVTRPHDAGPSAIK